MSPVLVQGYPDQCEALPPGSFGPTGPPAEQVASVIRRDAPWCLVPAKMPASGRFVAIEGEAAVDRHVAPDAPTLPCARLLIHADLGARSNRHGTPAPLRLLRGFRKDVAANDRAVPLSLCIDNLQGLRMHTVDDTGPLVDVTLPAGTYHVGVKFGSELRRYTMTLEPGASFDLYLRLAPGNLR